MEDINEISRQFLSCNSLNNFCLQASISDISWEEQKDLLFKTVHHPLVLKYPLSYPFQRSFLRSVIHGLENAGVDIHDEIYETYTSLLGTSTTEYVYKHYLIPEFKTVVSLKESSRLISDGTTGLHSWEAAVVLSEWCLQNIDKLKDKCVVELGSGAGLTGLTVAKCCSPKTLWLTDCHPTVLGLLKDNLKLNYSEGDLNTIIDNEPIDDRIIHLIRRGHGEIGVMNIAWEDIPSSTSLPRPQVLLAADVVYDSSLFPALCSSLAHYLHPQISQLQYTQPLVIIGCTVRNEDTFQEFIKMLGAYRIEYKDLDIPDAVHFIRNVTLDDPPVRMLQLTIFHMTDGSSSSEYC